ncbi:MAG: DNA-protecting protein DprA [Muribaculaceae bacterium]|nr:DNA-protecting protein DprA [Muribaculaceae bacterium]
MKIAIVGTRNPSVDYQEWEGLLLDKIDLADVTLVISGGAKGIDAFAKLFAGHRHIPYMEFAPQYAKYGRNATLRRNTQIVKESDMVIAFPTADSKGTCHTINEAHRLNRIVKVIKI